MKRRLRAVAAREQWMGLEHELRELERTDPAVRKASENYDRTVWRILFRGRINDRRRTEGKPPLRP